MQSIMNFCIKVLIHTWKEGRRRGTDIERYITELTEGDKSMLPYSDQHMGDSSLQNPIFTI